MIIDWNIDIPPWYGRAFEICHWKMLHQCMSAVLKEDDQSDFFKILWHRFECRFFHDFFSSHNSNQNSFSQYVNHSDRNRNHSRLQRTTWVYDLRSLQISHNWVAFSSVLQRNHSYENEFRLQVHFHTIHLFKVIFIWQILQADSVWNRGTRQLGNDLLDCLLKPVVYFDPVVYKPMTRFITVEA